MTTAAEALVRLLQLHGVQHVFGLCGDTSLPYYDAFHRLEHGITHVLTRDERSAAYMADGYARVTGRVGVCEGPSGGGATYLLPGLVEANESSVPVFGFTSDVPVASRGRYPLTELDQQSLYRPLTKWNGTANTAAQLPHLVRSAFRAMTTGRPGAAHLALPFDVLKQPVPDAELWAQPGHEHWPARRSGPDPQDVECAADRLVAARAPVIVCGGGVVSADACSELAALAEALDAPVCTTVSGRGTLADTHPLHVGVVGANGGVPATKAVLAQADLVLFVACRIGSTTTEHWQTPSREVPVLHLDIDPMTIGANYRTEVGLVGDAKLALQARSAKAAAFEALADDGTRPIRPEVVVRALNRLLPPGAVVVADPGTPCPYLSAYWHQPQAGRHFITNRAHGALGYALSAGFGAAVGRPGATVVAVMGDGSFGFTCGELETVARCGVPLKMVVFSNAVYGWIKASQKASYGQRYFGVDFRAGDHARVAEAFGVRAWRVDDPAQVEHALAQVLAHDGPALLDVVSQPLQDSAVPVSTWMG